MADETTAIDPDAFLNEIGQDVQEARQAVDKSAAAFTQRRLAIDRSFIVIVVISAWAIAILMYIYFTIDAYPEISCTAGKDCKQLIEAWREPAKSILDAITQLILPVVTLVIGYYFGTQKSEGGE